MTPAPAFGEDARWLRVVALATYALVGVPLIVEGGVDPRAFAAWLLCYLTFGLALWLSLAAASRPRGTALALLAVQGLCVPGLAVLLCNGFEGTLLVLVAMQLAARVSRRAGLVWIGAQSLLLAAAVAWHWSPATAILLAPPYLGFQLLAFFLFSALAREAAARRDLAAANAELRSTQAVLAETSRLEERLRISRELHDAVGHQLVTLSLNLEVAAHHAKGEALDQVRIAQSLAKLMLGDVGDIVATLDQPHGVDLRRALEALAAEVPRPRVHLTLPGTLVVDDEPAHTILRCSQEIVTNAVKHGDAENLWLDIVSDGATIEIRARDDGRGSASLSEGRGLSGMRERLDAAGGRLEVRTSPGAGFSVSALIPVRG